MAKLYFKYGCMGSCKTAQALTTKFNYEEKGMSVWLIKPETDNRDGADIIKSRIGLHQKADIIKHNDSIFDKYVAALMKNDIDVIIADECQFFTEAQIDDLRKIVDRNKIAVLCFGLRTDFQTRLFPGSKRLMEVADCIEEIKTMCKCGHKATVNARIDTEGNIVKSGEQIVIGGNATYTSMCHQCYSELT